MIDILPFLKKGDSYRSQTKVGLMISVGSSPELALESFTVSSDPCSFGLTVSYLRSVTSGLPDRRSHSCRDGEDFSRAEELCKTKKGTLTPP